MTDEYANEVYEMHCLVRDDKNQEFNLMDHTFILGLNHENSANLLANIGYAYMVFPDCKKLNRPTDKKIKPEKMAAIKKAISERDSYIRACQFQKQLADPDFQDISPETAQRMSSLHAMPSVVELTTKLEERLAYAEIAGAVGSIIMDAFAAHEKITVTQARTLVEKEFKLSTYQVKSAYEYHAKSMHLATAYYRIKNKYAGTEYDEAILNYPFGFVWHAMQIKETIFSPIYASRNKNAPASLISDTKLWRFADCLDIGSYKPSFELPREL